MQSEKVVLEFNDIKSEKPNRISNLLSQKIYEFRSSYIKNESQEVVINNLELPGPGDYMVDLASKSNDLIEIHIYSCNNQGLINNDDEYFIQFNNGELSSYDGEKLIFVDRKDQGYFRLMSEISSILGYAVFKSLSK